MTVRELLRVLQPGESLGSVGDTTVTSVAYDSRQAGPGSVFVALRGVKADGAAFAMDAVRRGALAIVSEAPQPDGVTLPWMRVTDGRMALAALAAELYGHPSDELTLVGITGTNGKTTTSYLLTSIFDAAGMRSGRIGTVGYRIADREI